MTTMPALHWMPEGPFVRTPSSRNTRRSLRGSELVHARGARDVLIAWLGQPRGGEEPRWDQIASVGVDHTNAGVRVLVAAGTDVGGMPGHVLGLPVVVQLATDPGATDYASDWAVLGTPHLAGDGEDVGKAQGAAAGSACAEYGPAAVYACSKVGEYVGGKVGNQIEEWLSGGVDCPYGIPDTDEQQWAATCQQINPALYAAYYAQWRDKVENEGLNDYQEACVLRGLMADCLRQGKGAGASCPPGQIAVPGGGCETMTGQTTAGGGANPGMNADGSCKWGQTQGGHCWGCPPDDRINGTACPPPPPPVPGVPPPMLDPSLIKGLHLGVGEDDAPSPHRSWLVVLGLVTLAAGAAGVVYRLTEDKPALPADWKHPLR